MTRPLGLWLDHGRVDRAGRFTTTGLTWLMPCTTVTVEVRSRAVIATWLSAGVSFGGSELQPAGASPRWAKTSASGAIPHESSAVAGPVEHTKGRIPVWDAALRGYGVT